MQKEQRLRLIKSVFLLGAMTYMDFPGGLVVKNPPAIREMWVRSLGQEDPLEKEMATSILAWETPWTEEPWGLKESDRT